MGTLEMRIELLKGMDAYIADTELTREKRDEWEEYIPPYAIDGDYEWVAENLQVWKEVCKLFGELIEKEDK